MAQPSVGTPIQLYYTTTASTAPSASNLVLGELALNATDGKLYYKTPSGVVTLLSSSAVSTGNLPGGSTGTIVYQSATGTTAYLTLGTTGSLLYAGSTAPAYASIGSAGNLIYSTGTAPASASIGSAGAIVYSSGTAPTSLPIGASNYVLTSSGTAPQWVVQTSLSVGTAASATFATSAGSATTATTATTSTNIAGGASNQILYQSGSGATSFVTAPSTSGYVLGWTGSAFSWVNAPTATTANNLTGGGANTVVYQSSAGVTAYLTNGTTGQVLQANTSSAPSWVNASSVAVASFQTSLSGLTPSTATTGAVTLAGTLDISSGGTGQTTATAAFNALAPTQTSNTGKYLTTNGSTTSWATVVSGATISNDTSTASNLYPMFSNATSGTPTTVYTSNAKLLYKPSTGDFQSSQLIANNGLILNSTTVSASYTVPSGQNAMSVGPITVATGQSVTVTSGQRWVVL